MPETPPATILLVDDDPDMRLTARISFNLTEGLTIVGEAETGPGAVAMWRALDPKPDVVVTGQMMPGMTGLEAAEVILSERPDQMIVLWTAYLTDLVQAEADRIGISLCIEKFQAHRLPEIVRGLRSS